MRFRYSRGLVLRMLLISTLLCLARVPTNAYQYPVVSILAGTDEGSSPTLSSGAPVEIDGRPIFQVYASVAGIAPEERAANIKQRILRLARKRGLGNDVIQTEDRAAWTEIVAGKEVLMVVTEGDAQAVGRPRTQLAEEYAEIIRRTLALYRQEHTLSALLRGVLFSLFATVGLFTVLFALVRIRHLIRSKLERLVNRAKENLSARPIWYRTTISSRP